MQNSAVGAIDIIRRPQAGDTTLLSNSRLYNEAEIRILLADSLADLHPERGAGSLDANDVQIGPALQGGAATGYTLTQGPYNGSTMYYATATKGSGNWLSAPPTGCSGSITTWPLLGQVTQVDSLHWNLVACRVSEQCRNLGRCDPGMAGIWVRSDVQLSAHGSLSILGNLRVPGLRQSGWTML